MLKAVVDCIRALERVATPADEQRAVNARERGHACSQHVLAMPYISPADAGAPPCPLLCKVVTHMLQLAPRPATPARDLPGRLHALSVSLLNLFCMALLYGRARRLSVENGGFRPGQVL